MSNWPATRASTVLHRTLSRLGWSDYIFAFHDGEEIGPRMLARIAKHTGLRPDDLTRYPNASARQGRDTTFTRAAHRGTAYQPLLAPRP